MVKYKVSFLTISFLFLVLFFPFLHSMEKSQAIDTENANLILDLLHLPLDTQLGKVIEEVNRLNAKGEALIHNLLKLKNVSAVSYCLTKLKALPNRMTSERISPLHYAVFYCYEAIAPLMMARADINAHDKQKQTPLHYAIRTNNSEALRFLLHYKPDLELQTKEGDTALYLATVQRSENAVRQLLKAGAQDNVVKGSMGEFSPLGLAIQLNSTDIIKIFYEYKEKDGLKGQFYAAAFEPGLILPFHNCGFSVKQKGVGGKTPLHVARADAVDMLLRLGADPYCFDDEGSAPIHVAAENNEALLMKFAQCNLILDFQDRKGKAPIFHAIKAKNANNFNFLFQKNRNALTAEGDTILHAAIKYENEEAAKFLIEQKLFVYSKNLSFEIPLHYAVKYFPELIRVLIVAGSNVYEKDKKGWMPIHLAAASHPRALPIVIDYCDINALDGQNNSPLVIADSSNNVASIQLLLTKSARKAGLSEQGTRNRKRIHFITQYYPERLQTELASLDVNETDDKGLTVAHYAALFNPGVLPLLRAAGADMNKVSHENHTPFSLAYIYNKRAMSDVVLAGGVPKLPQTMVMPLPKNIQSVLRYQKSTVAELPSTEKNDDEFIKRHQVAQARGYATAHSNDPKK